jgi:hypothetical protein
MLEQLFLQQCHIPDLESSDTQILFPQPHPHSSPKLCMVHYLLFVTDHARISLTSAHLTAILLRGAVFSVMSLCINNCPWREGMSCFCYESLQNCRKWLTASSCLSVHLSAWNSLAPAGWSFVKFDIWGKICQENSSFIKIWHEWQALWKFMIMSNGIFLRISIVSDKHYRENQNTFFQKTMSFMR